MLALRSLKAREHLGLFRAALQPKRGILRCRLIASACGTKSLPCGLRARRRPPRYERVWAEPDRDRFCVSANKRVQTNFIRDLREWIFGRRQLLRLQNARRQCIL